MSSFIDNLEAKKTGNRVPVIKSFVRNIDNNAMRSYPDDPSMPEWEISTEYHQRIACSPENLNKAMKNAKRRIQQYLYGEIKEYILELEMAIYAGDQHKAVAIIDKILKTVYE